MRCCGNRLSQILIGLVLLLAAQTALATEIVIRNARLALSEDEYSLSADFDFELNSRLEEAVNKGVVLYFTTDFELTRSRWYWFDEMVGRRTRIVQLSYHALTRQYRLSSGALHQSYSTLAEALRILSRLRNWTVLEKNDVPDVRSLRAGLRLRLDLSLMPKTFQVSALSNRDWTLASNWTYWPFDPAEEGSATLPDLSSVPSIRTPTGTGDAR